MTSDKQIIANQTNGQLGGVKTNEGKEISKLNAMKHGLLSNQVLLDGEDEALLVELGKKIRTDLRPESEMELLLAERIITNFWRLKRSMQIETEMIQNELKSSFGAKNVGEVLSIDSANSDSFGKLIRYEASIERGIFKALHELQRIQAARSGEKPPLPIAIDVDNADNE